MQLSILLDATKLGAPNPTGVECMVDCLFPPLVQALLSQNVKVSLLGHHYQSPLPIPGAEWVYSPYQKGWGQFGVAKEIKRLKPDLFYTPSGIIPLFGQTKKVMMIHDLAAFRYPKAYSNRELMRLRNLTKLAVKRCAGITTVSSYTKQEIVKWLNYPKAKITVCYNALPNQQSKLEPQPLSTSCQIPPYPYFIFIGRIERKKNLLPVIAAVELLTKQKQPYGLVLVGGKGHGAEEVSGAIKQLPKSVQDKIQLLGYLDEQSKTKLLRHAVALLAPCPDEGFGMPVLEAFKAGVPVLAANQGALPEIVGEAGILCPPKAEQQWADQMLLLSTDQALRSKLIRLGQKRLADFNWEKTAQLVADSLISWARS